MKNREQFPPEGDPKNWTMLQLEDFGRIRLSRHFFMRDMLYSEVASVHGKRNVPDHPELAIEVGKKLCTVLLEPLHATFGHVSIRSAFRSAVINDCGEKYRNVAGTEKNHARHVWDRRDKENDKKGATACIVIPWFVDYLERRPAMSWRAMAWWIHDHLPYSEMMFFRCRRPEFEYAAFNIRWHETAIRRSIKHTVDDDFSRKDMREHSPGCHVSEYPGFPKLKRPNEYYPNSLG